MTSRGKRVSHTASKGTFNGIYRGERLNHVAFPLGGIGAGMFSLSGTGAICQMSVRNKPDTNHTPNAFAALWVKGTTPARVLEGPVPRWKIFSGSPSTSNFLGNANGLGDRTSYGLPHFSDARFSSRFPFATVDLKERKMPIGAELTGWSPFIPGNSDDSSLPVAALEYTLVNRAARKVSGVFSFHCADFMRSREKDAGGKIEACAGGFVFVQPPQAEKPETGGSFAVWSDDPGAQADCAWLRGGWYDPMTIVWKNVSQGRTVCAPPHTGEQGNGASLYIPFSLAPRSRKTIRLLFAWHVPHSAVQVGKKSDSACGDGCACNSKEAAQTYSPWYTSRFADVQAVIEYWGKNYERLRVASLAFSDALYDTTLPGEVMEAVTANLAILKSPTCLRQPDGRFWGWEGSFDGSGCCHGTCTHVWNYAQSMPHLFPDLERSLRETEFLVLQDQRGHQNFRSNLPIASAGHDQHAAADGQLGGLMKLHREWRISGDTAWMKKHWPAARASLDYCIAAWDPDRTGTLREPHHNTYDIDFWGADGMCTSFYLGALAAAVRMGETCGDDIGGYRELLARGKTAMEADLWNGEYFIQKIQWQGLRAPEPAHFKTHINSNVGYPAETLALLKKEGPKYQYGNGCLADGVLGDWLALCCGLAPVLDRKKTERHLRAVYRNNFKPDLSDHANTQRPGFAMGLDGGLVLCTWPQGDKLSLPFPYSDEVWTGIEYQVAAHLVMFGRVREGLDIVRAARRRYDGTARNPFDEYECGHWYARAMSSWSLLQAFTGARYDAVEEVLYLAPQMKGDWRAFLAAAGGHATIGMKKGKPFCTVRQGAMRVERIVVNGAAFPAS